MKLQLHQGSYMMDVSVCMCDLHKIEAVATAGVRKL